MTQPNNPINNASARTLEVAGLIVDYLVARQNQTPNPGKINAEPLAAAIGATVQEVYDTVRWIRDNFASEIPLLSSREGYEVSIAWRPNIEFFLWRFRIIDTYMRITRRTVIEPLRRRGVLDADQVRLLNQVDAALIFTGTTFENLITTMEAQLA